MTQVFDEKGDVHPITSAAAGPCVITQLKTLAKDGYEAAQIGLVEFVKTKNVTKPQAGHFAKTEARGEVIREWLWSLTPTALWLPRPATGCW